MNGLIFFCALTHYKFNSNATCFVVRLSMWITIPCINIHMLGAYLQYYINIQKLRNWGNTVNNKITTAFDVDDLKWFFSNFKLIFSYDYLLLITRLMVSATIIYMDRMGWDVLLISKRSIIYEPKEWSHWPTGIIFITVEVKVLACAFCFFFYLTIFRNHKVSARWGSFGLIAFLSL